MRKRSSSNSGWSTEEHSGASIFEFLQRELTNCRVSGDGGGDAPPELAYRCGFVGFFGYEADEHAAASARRRDLARLHRDAVPDAAWLFADRALAFDHATGAVYMMTLAAPGAAARAVAAQWRTDVSARLAACVDAAATVAAAVAQLAPPKAAPPCHVRFVADVVRGGYIQNVRRCLSSLHEGESYEICLTNQIALHSVAAAAPSPSAAADVESVSFSSGAKNEELSKTCEDEGNGASVGGAGHGGPAAHSTAADEYLEVYVEGGKSMCAFGPTAAAKSAETVEKEAAAPPPFALYTALRRANPAPYAAFFRFDRSEECGEFIWYVPLHISSESCSQVDSPPLVNEYTTTQSATACAATATPVGSSPPPPSRFAAPLRSGSSGPARERARRAVGGFLSRSRLKARCHAIQIQWRMRRMQKP